MLTRAQLVAVTILMLRADCRGVPGGTPLIWKRWSKKLQHDKRSVQGFQAPILNASGKPPTRTRLVVAKAAIDQDGVIWGSHDVRPVAKVEHVAGCWSHFPFACNSSNLIATEFVAAGT